MRWSLWLLVPACSFSANNATAMHDAPPPDVSIDARADARADAGPRDCMANWMNHTVSFAAPVALLPLNTTAYERDPFLSNDELTIYFSTTRTDTLGGTDVYTATRSSTADPFGPVTKFLPGSTADGGEGKLAMTGDGTFLVVSTNHAGGQGSYDIWAAKQAMGVWGQLTDLGGINDNNDIYDPTLNATGTHIYYAPAEPTPQHIVEATRANVASNFGSPMTLTELNDPAGGGVGDPTLSADEHVMLYSTSQIGGMGLGDIWYATRAGTTGPFSSPMVVPGVNSPTFDGDAYLSADGCTLYFASYRVAGDDWDLFYAVQQ